MPNPGRQATGRATLTPVARTKGGKTYWVARGQVPTREPDGSVGSRRVERGFGPSVATEKQRQAQCAAWNTEYEERFRNPRRLITFARAWDNYVDYLGEDNAPIYEVGIIKCLGARQCSDIDDAAMGELVREVFPNGATPATLNRHLYTPVIAALQMALKEKAPQLTRPKGHNDVKPVVVATPEWFTALWPYLNPNQRALVMFLATHGRRIREALSRRPRDLTGNTLDLGRTKTGPMVIDLEAETLRHILTMPGWKRRTWLFGAGPNSANSVRRDLRAACIRAGVEWITPHKFGRHTSVTRMLRRGYSVAHVAQAHNMTPEMVTRRYGHLTITETTAALHEVGGDLARQIIGGNAGDNTAGIAAKADHNVLELQTSDGARVLPKLPPSEGSALSNCATGAELSAGKSEESAALLSTIIDRTRRQQTPADGGNVGDDVAS